MNFQISNLKFKIHRGYTLIEILVVLVIVGVLAIMVFAGIESYNKNQYLSNSQREFVTALRGAQNRVLNGAGGANFEVVTVNQASYAAGGRTVNLPTGITVANGSLPLSICFANPLLSTFALNNCGNCSAGSFFACDASNNKTTSGLLEVTFDNGATTKKVIIEGSGMTINRVYAQ